MIRFPECRRGDTWSYELPIALASGSLADCIVTMTGKRRASDEDEDAIFQIDNDELGGVTIVEPNAPIARVRLTLSDELTATFPTKSLVADVQIGLADGTTRTVENLDPTFPVRADVTRRTTATP